MDDKEKPTEMSDWEREVLHAGGYKATASTQLRRDAEILRDEKANAARESSKPGKGETSESDQGPDSES